MVCVRSKHQHVSALRLRFSQSATRVSIEQAMQMLGLNLVLHGSQYRGGCPACKTGGDRALIVTPAKGLFYCFAKKAGGDAIALTAHIRGTSVKDAADQLDRAFGTVQNSTSTVSKSRATAPQAPEARKQPAFDPETYASRLDASHASLAPFGHIGRDPQALESRLFKLRHQPRQARHRSARPGRKYPGLCRPIAKRRAAGTHHPQWDKSARDYPMLQIKIYDATTKMRTPLN
jgi:hypothetical protein